jgi:hypothetical protein
MEAAAALGRAGVMLGGEDSMLRSSNEVSASAQNLFEARCAACQVHCGGDNGWMRGQGAFLGARWKKQENDPSFNFDFADSCCTKRFYPAETCQQYSAFIGISSCCFSRTSPVGHCGAVVLPRRSDIQQYKL